MMFRSLIAFALILFTTAALADPVLDVVETAGDYYTITARDSADANIQYWQIKVDVQSGGIFSLLDLTDDGDGSGGHTDYMDNEAYYRNATFLNFKGRGGKVLSRSGIVPGQANRLSFDAAPDGSSFTITYTETPEAEGFFHTSYGSGSTSLTTGELLTTVIMTIRPPVGEVTTWDWEIRQENISTHTITSKVWAQEFMINYVHGSVNKTFDTNAELIDGPFDLADPKSYVRWNIGDNPGLGLSNRLQMIIDVQSGAAEHSYTTTITQGSWAGFDSHSYPTPFSYSGADLAAGDTRVYAGQVILRYEDPPLDPVANAGPDQTINDTDDNGQELVTLNGSASTTPTGTAITEYVWTEGGNPIATGVNPQLMMNVGVHTVMLTVTNDLGLTDTDEVVIDIPGVPTSFAAAGPDQTILDADNNGSHVATLDGSQSAWTVEQWSWAIAGTEIATGVNPQVTLAVGVHTIVLTCTDFQDRTDTDTVVIEILDGSPKPPVADAGFDFTVADINGSGDETVILNGSGSTDFDGTIVSYEWELGGSVIATGAQPAVLLPMGESVITLTVTDDDGMTDSDTVTITVVEYVPGAGGDLYVGAYEADTEFEDVTAEDMAIIRSKNVLMASRSFGFNLESGFNYLKNRDAMYTINFSGRYNTGDVDNYDAVPENIFDTANFVGYIPWMWPWERRVYTMKWFIDNRYSQILDAAVIFYHTGDPAHYPYYATMMNTMKLTYPNIRFIFVGSGCSPVAGASGNMLSQQFRELVLANHLNVDPIYDMGDILSTREDGTKCTFDQGGVTYRMMCPEFNINGDLTHPNAQFPQERMGKGMIVMLKKLFIEPSTSVQGRFVFYNNSCFDGNDAGVNAADDGAIATDKAALLPGQAATQVNYTSYDKGINGLMVDILDPTGNIAAEDFEFKVGNDDDSSGWAAGPVPVSVTVRAGEGVGQSDRVTIIFADGAITGKWLQVKVLANANTGLATDDVFYFGNAVGETGNSLTDAIVDAADEVACRNNPRTFMRPATIFNPYDHNKDGKVDATDEIISRNNVTTMVDDLELITP